MAIRDNQGFDPAAGNPELAVNTANPVGGFGDEDPFARIVQFLKKRAWIVGVTIALGLLVSRLVNHFSTRLYTAQASIEVESEDVSSQFRLEQMQDLRGSGYQRKAGH